MVAPVTMATLAHPAQDFTVLPQLPADVFTAPLKKPSPVGEDWVEPAQTACTSEDHRIRDALFSRTMKVLPGRAASAFTDGLARLTQGAGGGTGRATRRER